MNDDASRPAVPDDPGSPEPTLRRVCSELIALRERTDRQHRLFEQALSQSRDDLQARFDQFARDSQHAYRSLRDELSGEKRYSVAMLNALVDLALDLQKIAAARPPLGEGLGAWADAVCGSARRAEAMLAQFGVHRYDAVIGSPYQPALHERVGSESLAGMGPLLVARQMEPGYASQQPDFVLRRAKVLITE